jgi:hypothetical protein
MRWRRFVAGLCFGLVLVSCAARSGPRDSGDASVALPTLPPRHELYPNEYDEAGCNIVDPEEPICPGPAVGDEPALEPGDWQTLRGFEGPYYDTQLTARDVVVIDSSVSTSTQGNWEAWGLVRNETEVPTGAALSATLLDSDGNVLTSAQSVVGVSSIRPGEPAPFDIVADVPTEDVGEVQWTVTPTKPAGEAFRDFVVMQFWTLPFGDRARADNLYRDAGEPPYPFVSAGGVTALADKPLADAQVEIAWIDSAGRVVATGSATVGEIPNNPEASKAPPSLVKGVVAPYFIVVTEPAIAKAISEGAVAPMMWVEGSTQR